MRHHVARKGLGRHSKHRELMFRNMLVSLFDHERVQTTQAKAKMLRRRAEKMITVAKKGSLHARRQAFALLRSEDSVKKLFDEIAPRFKERNGGYTRIYKLGWRAGDAAPLSLVELLAAAKEGEKKKSAVKKAKEALKKVAPGKKGKAEKTEAEKKVKKAKAAKGAKEGKEAKEAKAEKAPRRSKKAEGTEEPKAEKKAKEEK
jgi:large subunit ribosomal protein L17